MKVKISTPADLENKKLIFRQIGAILALACIFLAFELKNDTIDSMSDVQRYIDSTPTELIPITIQRPPIAPAPLVAASEIAKVNGNSTDAEAITIEATVSQSEVLAEYTLLQQH